MAQANLPISYWGDVFLTIAYVLNRVPSKSVTSTPYELWTGHKPDLSNLKPWVMLHVSMIYPISMGNWH